jgi:Flp pilus assembly protein TadD
MERTSGGKTMAWTRQKGRAIAISAAALVGACAQSGLDAPPSLLTEPAKQAVTTAPATPAKTSATPAADLATLAATHAQKPTDATAALAYARALRQGGQKADALAVLDKAAGKAPARDIQRERGMLALDLGQASRAETLLKAAQDPKSPDWRVHSALGAALAATGKQQEAQLQFARALTLSPDNPAVLNNLALSYALDGKRDEAEKLLKRAQRSDEKSTHVRQNLALVASLNDTAPARAPAIAETPRQRDDRSASLPQPSMNLGGPLH